MINSYVLFIINKCIYKNIDTTRNSKENNIIRNSNIRKSVCCYLFVVCFYTILDSKMVEPSYAQNCYFLKLKNNLYKTSNFTSQISDPPKTVTYIKVVVSTSTSYLTRSRLDTPYLRLKDPP